MATKTYLKRTYLPTYLCDSSDSSDSRDSSDSSDSSDSMDSCDEKKKIVTTKFCDEKKLCKKKKMWQNIFLWMNKKKLCERFCDENYFTIPNFVMKKCVWRTKLWHEKQFIVRKKKLVIKKQFVMKKSRIWETKNLSTDADSRTNTIFERLRNLSKKINKK